MTDEPHNQDDSIGQALVEGDWAYGNGVLTVFDDEDDVLAVLTVRGPTRLTQWFRRLGRAASRASRGSG